ncbi:MAG: glycosyltransferase family 4 protein [Pseudomonadota bacterium]
MKKIVVVGLRGFPNVQGGIEKHCEELYPRIVAQGQYQVRVLARAGFHDASVSEYRGVTIKTLWTFKSSGLEAFYHSFVSVLFAVFTRPDILHVHAVGPGLFILLAKLGGLKVVFTHHGFDYRREKWGGLARFVLRMGEYIALKLSDQVIAVSGVAAQELRSMYRREVHTVNNGVTVQPGEGNQEYLINQSLVPGKYFLSVSRIVREKGQVELVKSFQGLGNTDMKLVIVGDKGGGDYVEELQDSIGDHSGIVMLGTVYGENLQALFYSAAGFVHASSLEGNPIVVLEAMSYGLALRVSDIPAHRELKLDESEYFPLGNARALSQGMQDIAERDQELRSVEKIDRVKAEFDWDVVSDKTQAIYGLVV